MVRLGSRTGSPVSRRSAMPASKPTPAGASTTALRKSAQVSALSGILFAGLFVLALVLVRQGPGLGVPDRVYADFYQVGRGNVIVTAGLYVVPFAGIAFMWHMSALRTVIEALPGPSSEMPRWLQLSSGVLFVCMLFAGTAAVGAVALLTVVSTAPLPPPEVARALSAAGYGLVFVFGVRAAGMFMITTTTLSRKRGLVPGWFTLISYLAAAFLLVSTTFHPAILLIFPGWVLVLSVVLLVDTHGHHSPLSLPRTAAAPRRAHRKQPKVPLQETAHEHDDRA